MMRLALNRMVMPRRRFAAFAAAARELGVTEVEIRNDLPGVEIADGTAPDTVRRQAASAGVNILAINALQRFDDWNTTRAAEAETLARYARGCGCAALVLCPVNDPADSRSAAERHSALCSALTGLAPILRSVGVRGLIEPLGFPQSALRTKRAALEAMRETGTGNDLALLHDTFHHYLSGEAELFPNQTGLVHASGVEDHALELNAIVDDHRVLVGCNDRLGTMSQLRQLTAAGYAGPVSLEPFAPSIRDTPNILEELMHSMELLGTAA